MNHKMAIALLTGIALSFSLGLGCNDASTPAASETGGTGNAGGSSNGQGGGTSTNSDPPVACPSRSNDSSGNLKVVAAEANNYKFSSTLSLKVDKIKPNSELSYDWKAVTKDFLGHPVDPKADIGMVSTILWTLTQAEFETKLNADEVAQRNMAAGASIFTKGNMTSGDFSNFEIITGGPIKHEDLMSYFDPATFDPAKSFYTIMVASGEKPGMGTKMMRGFVLDPASDKTQITIDSESTSLTYTADLHSLQTTPVPAGKGNIVVDWTDMDGKKNAMGNPFDAATITRARVASYDYSPTELETKFLDLQLVSTGMWEGEVETGTSLVLSTLKSTSSKDSSGVANGPAFSGIDTKAKTWILALECGRCANPAPWYLTVLKPCN